MRWQRQLDVDQLVPVKAALAAFAETPAAATPQSLLNAFCTALIRHWTGDVRRLRAAVDTTSAARGLFNLEESRELGNQSDAALGDYIQSAYYDVDKLTLLKDCEAAPALWRARAWALLLLLDPWRMTRDNGGWTSCPGGETLPDVPEAGPTARQALCRILGRKE